MSPLSTLFWYLMLITTPANAEPTSASCCVRDMELWFFRAGGPAPEGIIIHRATVRSCPARRQFLLLRTAANIMIRLNSAALWWSASSWKGEKLSSVLLLNQKCPSGRLIFCVQPPSQKLPQSFLLFFCFFFFWSPQKWHWCVFVLCRNSDAGLADTLCLVAAKSSRKQRGVCAESESRRGPIMFEASGFALVLLDVVCLGLGTYQ